LIGQGRISHGESETSREKQKGREPIAESRTPAAYVHIDAKPRRNRQEQS